MSSPTTDDEPLDRKAAALALAARGFHVLAVDRRSKKPDRALAPDGFKRASRDPETIAGWFDAKPTCNIGIACGAEYGLLAVDVDVKNGANGMATLQSLGIDVLTLIANTPSGGFHLYFKHPGVPVRARLDGIDLKGANGGGYVLAPPSVLPDGAYTWRDAEIPVAEFPSHLLNELRTGATKSAAPSAVGPVAGTKVPQGRRHNRLIELSAIYRGMGLGANDIGTLLWSHARADFDPPFCQDNLEDAREVDAAVRWIADKAANQDSPAIPLILETAELRARAKAAPDCYLLEPILHESAALMIYGSTGIGKSHIGLCIAGALATGAAFMDWTIPGPVDVLYVDGEMSLDELDTRIGCYFGDAPLPRLKWIAAQAQDEELPNLADPAGQEFYVAAIVQTGAKCVIFDNLSCLRSTSAELPENSTEAWQPVAKFVRRLKRMGVAVILVHHASKAGQQRGSTDHTAPMDTVIALRALKPGQADPRAENDIEFEFEKHRRFSGEAAQTFRAKAIGDADGRVAWQRVGGDALADDVARLRSQGQSIRTIAETLQRSKAGIEKALARAKARGLLPLKDAQ